MATELEAAGCDLDDPLWSARVLLERPELIVDVHAAYLEAGADILTTASYQATFDGLARRGLDDRAAADLMHSATRLAREAVESAGRDDVLVAASIGSYGAFLADGSEYTGDYGRSIEELMDFHRRRLGVLEQGADVLAFETVPSIVEAEAIGRLLGEKEGPTAWLAFSCSDAERMCDGTPVGRAVELLRDTARVEAIGINCTAPRHIEGLLRELAAWPRARVVYPNSGEGYEPQAHGWSGSGTAAPEFVQLAQRWLDAGADLIGGCCRTTPTHIRALARWRDTLD